MIFADSHMHIARSDSSFVAVKQNKGILNISRVDEDESIEEEKKNEESKEAQNVHSEILRDRQLQQINYASMKNESKC